MEHAKWSPVSTAWYALKPELILLKEVRGGDAEALADALPGLVTVEVGEDGERVAVMGDVEEYPLLMEKVVSIARGCKGVQWVVTHMVGVVQS